MNIFKKVNKVNEIQEFRDYVDSLHSRIKVLEEKLELYDLKDTLVKLGDKYELKLSLSKCKYFTYRRYSTMMIFGVSVIPDTVAEPEEGNYEVKIDDIRLTYGSLEELNKEIESKSIDIKIKAYLHDKKEEEEQIEYDDESASYDDCCEDDWDY